MYIQILYFVYNNYKYVGYGYLVWKYQKYIYYTYCTCKYLKYLISGNSKAIQSIEMINLNDTISIIDEESIINDREEDKEWLLVQ